MNKNTKAETASGSQNAGYLTSDELDIAKRVLGYEELEAQRDELLTQLKAMNREEHASRSRAITAEAQRDELLEALKEARPTLVNAIREGTQDWRKDTREMILARVDAEIAEVEVATATKVQ